jgi:hypothetical protein
LAQQAGLGDLAAGHVRIGHRCGVNARVKIACLAAGADSIEDMDLLTELAGGLLGRCFREGYGRWP